MITLGEPRNAWSAGRALPLWVILLCVVAFHAPLLFMQLPANSFDANFHMSMASHYAHHWFDPWNEKSLAGFSQTTYPPLTHQWMAIFSHLVGLTWAYMMVQGIILLLLPVAVWRFARLWTSDRAASFAGLCSVFLGSLCLLVYQDGQIGTTSATTLFLLMLPFLHRYALKGNRADLALAVALSCTAATAHHATLLFGLPFFALPVLWLIFADFREQFPGQSFAVPARRVATFGVLAIVGMFLVLLPFFMSLLKNPIRQIPIPHQSRANFLLQPIWGVHYWLIPVGFVVLALPYIVFKGWEKKLRPLFLGFYLALLFGLGGTTPIPRLLLGRAFQVLTFERFTFWAVLLAMPFVGLLMTRLLDKYGFKAAALLSVLIIGAASLAVSWNVYFPLIEQPLDVKPVIDFLNHNDHDQYRYMTLGFGNGISKIACYTNASSVDGEYNSGRTLPEMTHHAAAQFTTAKYYGLEGIEMLSEMLRHANHYGLRYIFVHDTYYEPLLTFAGWRQIQSFNHGEITVWTTVGVPPATRISSSLKPPLWQGVMWGTLPLLTSLMTIYLAFHIRRRSGKPAAYDESQWSDEPERSNVTAPVLVHASETPGSVSRIALVTAFPPGRGDLAEYGFQLARTLRDSFGISPVIYADQSPRIERELPGFEVVRCWRFNSAASFVRLVWRILRRDFDAVWFNIGLSTMGNKPHSAMIASALPCILRACGINTHVTLHAFSENVDFSDAAVPFPAVYRLGARAATRLLLAANGVHVLLPSFRDRLVQLFGVNCGTIFVHPHGVFEFEGDAGQGTPRAKARILAFGSWGTYKKLEPLLEAFEFVKQQSPDAELVVAGGDHPQAKGYLQSCATRYAHEPRIKFLGYVPENEVAALFRSSAVTVMPYSSCAGSSGVAHLACEYGVPILASDVPDLRELAQYENLRFEFYGGPSGHGLPEELARLIHDDTLRKSIAEHNQEAVRSLSLREVVGSYLRSFALTVKLPAKEDPSPAEI